MCFHSINPLKLDRFKSNAKGGGVINLCFSGGRSEEEKTGCIVCKRKAIVACVILHKISILLLFNFTI